MKNIYLKIFFTLALSFLPSLAEAYTDPNAPYCHKSRYCMACNKHSVNTCDACYSLSLGKVGVRSLTSGECLGLYKYVVGDCRIYPGTQSNAVTDTGITMCRYCDTGYKYYRHFVDSITSLRQNQCLRALPLGCVDMDDCDMQTCWESNTVHITYNGCRKCPNNWRFTGTYDSDRGWSGKCLKGKIQYF
jgi:hypothetical protein